MPTAAIVKKQSFPTFRINTNSKLSILIRQFFNSIIWLSNSIRELSNSYNDIS